jgi:hypothetical protein
MATLNVRNIDAEAVQGIKRAARARGLTVGQYLPKLVALHDAARARADAGDDGLQAELMALGLETVQA